MTDPRLAAFKSNLLQVSYTRGPRNGSGRGQDLTLMIASTNKPTLEDWLNGKEFSIAPNIFVSIADVPALIEDGFSEIKFHTSLYEPWTQAPREGVEFRHEFTVNLQPTH